MPKLIADLHIHSHFSRATSRDLDLEHLAQWAQLKGVQVVGTGDIAHPGWLAEIKAKLEPAEEGLFRLTDEVAAAVAATVPAACHAPVRFLLAGEVSNIYKKGGQVRKVHHLIFMPSLAAVERLQAALEKIGNIRSDGRPILGLDSRNLLEIVLETDPQGYLIPAHIWTPWFAVLGSKSGFDTIEECFDELTPHIFALETGLSSDPPMNWRISALDRYTLVSNSDAHSPPKLAREATIFHTDRSYPALFAALQSGDPTTFGGTIEFFPEEGKYHCDGHRNCAVRWQPEETAAHDGRCSVCGKAVTVGVLNRVAALADRSAGERPARTHPYHNLITLPEVLGDVFGVGASSRQVQAAYLALLGKLGPELSILQDLPVAEIALAGGERLAEGIRRMRNGEVAIAPGYDGEYGVIKLFEAQERLVSSAQLDLFGGNGRRAPATRRPAREEQADAARPSLMVDDEPGSAPSGVPAAEPPRLVREAAPALAPLSPGIPASTLFDGLNPQQQAAVRWIDAPLLIVAGPGTGKTRTLTHRIAYLVSVAAAPPGSILAITFTNKAAEEMAERLVALVGEETGQQLTIQTFHAFCATLLRSGGDRLGLTPDFTIATDADRLSIMRQVRPAWSEKLLNEALQAIATAKDQLLRPNEVGGQVGPDDEEPLADLYLLYDHELRKNSLVDFDDLILLAVRLLSEHGDRLRTIWARYRWISVDEYQDINLAQYQLLRLLTGENATQPANLCAIGDPDQAIYGFRGADRRYFLRFQADYLGAQVLRLEQNYRSSPLILAAASQVIAGNVDEERLRIWTDYLDQTRLEIHPAATAKAEAESVVHTIEQMVGGTSLFSLDSGRVEGTGETSRGLGDFAVLYRTGAQSQALVEAFHRSGLPYQALGQTPLTEYKEIREIVTYLHLVHDPQAELYLRIAMNGVSQRVGAVLRSLLGELAATATPVAELVEALERFMLATLRRELSESARERVAQLRRRATPYGDNLRDFLSAIALQQGADLYDPRADRVALMTLHAAKGLEFPVVFLVGCEEGLLPYERAGRPTDLEEERRLFFVGMTRAQRRLILSYARTRFLFGQRMQNPPSRFLADIEQTLTEIHSMAQRTAKQGEPALRQLGLFA